MKTGNKDQVIQSRVNYVVAMFTRHQLVPEQQKAFVKHLKHLVKVAGKDHTLTEISFRRLASRTIQTMDEAKAIARELLQSMADALREVTRAGCADVGNIDIFGVVPAPLRAALEMVIFSDNVQTPIRIYEAFNVNRAEEGQPPKFEFREWVMTQCWNVD